MSKPQVQTIAETISRSVEPLRACCTSRLASRSRAHAMCIYQHDAVAVARTVGLPDIGTHDTDTTDSRGASQPAVSGTHGGPSVEATPETRRVSLSSDDDGTPQPAPFLPLQLQDTEKDAVELHDPMAKF